MDGPNPMNINILRPLRRARAPVERRPAIERAPLALLTVPVIMTSQVCSSIPNSSPR